jgi:diacylglycerol kinase family enzyme
VSALESAAREGGLDVIRVAKNVDVAAVIREQMRLGLNLFVAAGGDGTINSVIQPLINSEATLGVVPVGTFNHFARDLGLPLHWRDALDVVFSGDTRQVDAARVNERFFVNNVSIGLYPELVARREERGREYPRWRAWIYAAFVTLRKYPHVTLAVESDYLNEIVRTHVFVVSNNSYDLSRLGVETPRTTLEEGRLSVYWLPHMPRIALARFLAQYFAGRAKSTAGFRSFRTVRLRVQSPRKRLHVGIDGEVASMTPPLVITIMPKSLLVKVPREG